MFILAVGLALLRGPKDSFNLLISRFIVLAILVANALSGHSGSTGLVGIIPDTLHQLAAGLWAGGLLQLALIWLPKKSERTNGEKRSHLLQLLTKFSNLALVSVILVLISGAILTINQLDSPTQLLDNLYGRAVLAKILLLLPIIGIAAINRRVIVPRLASDSTNGYASLLQRLRRWVLAEVALVAVILFFAASLTLSSPPSHVPDGTTITDSGRSQHLHQTGEKGTISLDILRDKIGENRFEISVQSPNGEPLDGILKIWMRFEFQGEELGTIEVTAEPHDDSHFLFEGAYMNLPGEWLIKVLVRIRGEAKDLAAEFRLDVE